MSEPTSTELVDQGIEAADAGRDKEALDLFERAAELDPDNADAFYNLGVLAGQLYLEDAVLEEYYKFEDMTDGASFFAIAEAAFARVLEIDPDHEEARNNLGILRESGDGPSFVESEDE